MNIIINEKLIGTLNQLASDRNTTPESYVGDYINNHLFSQYKRIVVDKISSENLDNLSVFDSVITDKKVEIQAAYDLEHKDEVIEYDIPVING